MENKIVTAIFKDSTHTKVSDVWQYDYGQILRIQGLDLPTAVEVDFAVAGASESIARIGTTKDGVTDVVIPDSLIETGKNLVAYIYLRDSASGNTEYQIDMLVTKRAKPEAYDRPEDKELFGQAIEAVNTAADRAEKAGKTAQEAATKTGQDAEQTAQDRVEVAKMVETVSGISEQVKKVEELSQKAQEAATKAGKSEQAADGFKTQAESAKKGAEAAAVKTAEDKTAVDNAKTEVLEAKTEVNADRTVVEQVKNEVEQLGGSIAGAVQSGVQEITQAGTAQKTAVEAAGTQAVESVESVKASAIEAVGAEKTAAVQAVQSEGTKQTGNVTAEGTKQVKAVQDKGTEVLQSIPEDFTTQMESKLDKNQGSENAGKALVIGEDGGIVPGKPQAEGAGAIVNTASGEAISVFDSADRKNKGFRMTGKTTQMSTSGVNLFDVSKVVPNNNVIRNGDGSIKVIADESNNGFSANTPNTLKDYCPLLIVGQTYTLSANTAASTKQIYLKESGTVWTYGQSVQITKEMLDSVVLFYSDINKTSVISNIQIEKGSTATAYEPYSSGKPSPSPEYEQDIESAGKLNADTQKYEVVVKAIGKNLFDIEKAKNTQNWFTSVQSGYSDFEIYVGKGNTVTISYTDTLEAGLGFYAGIVYEKDRAVGAWLYNSTNISANTKKVTFTANEDYVYIRCSTNDISKFMDNIKTLQVEIGKNQTDFVPGKEQLLTLASDRPITKWDKLVEQGGEIGWLYKSRKIEFDGSETFDERFLPSLLYNLEVGKYSEGGIFCNYSNSEGIGKGNNIGSTISFRKATTYWNCENAQQFKEFLKTKKDEGIPLYVLYETISTEFVPLPQSEQIAIRNLRTYYPSTTLTNDQGCVMELDYVCDTKLYIDNKVSAKVASIISQYQLNAANLLSLMPMETQATMIENDTNNILGDMEVQKHE